VSPYTPPFPKPQLEVRGVVSVDLNQKPHPAVVVRIFKDEGRALIIYGTGTARDELVAIRVPDRSASARALRLTKTTYFYGDALRSVKLSHLTVQQGRCPPELFLQIRTLVEGALATRASGEFLKDLAPDAIPIPAVLPSTEGC